MSKEKAKGALRKSLTETNGTDLEYDYPKLFEAIAESMQSFSDQENADLKAEVERLRDYMEKLSLWLHNEYPEVYNEYFLKVLRQ